MKQCDERYIYLLLFYTLIDIIFSGYRLHSEEQLQGTWSAHILNLYQWAYFQQFGIFH